LFNIGARKNYGAPSKGENTLQYMT